MIIAGGVNIYPQEIEGVIQQHDKVQDVAVFGIPNKDMGEEIKCVIELIPGAEPSEALRDDVVAFYQDKMAKQKWPQWLSVVVELPKTPSGKIQKAALRAQLKEQGVQLS